METFPRFMVKRHAEAGVMNRMEKQRGQSFTTIIHDGRATFNFPIVESRIYIKCSNQGKVYEATMSISVVGFLKKTSAAWQETFELRIDLAIMSGKFK